MVQAAENRSRLCLWLSSSMGIGAMLRDSRKGSRPRWDEADFAVISGMSCLRGKIGASPSQHGLKATKIMLRNAHSV